VRTSSVAWNSKQTNSAALNAAMRQTNNVGGLGGALDWSILKKTLRLGPVIHVGDPAGTTPTNVVSRGLPSGIGDGAAAGPYRGATALASALAQAGSFGTAGSEIRHGAYDYSAQAPKTMRPTVQILSLSLANPTVITTKTPHYITDGELVNVNDVTTGIYTGGGGAINKKHVATVTGPTTFTVPVNCTTGGTNGTVFGHDGFPGKKSSLKAVTSPVLADSTIFGGTTPNGNNMYLNGGKHTNPAGHGITVGPAAVDVLLENFVAIGSAGVGSNGVYVDPAAVRTVLRHYISKDNPNYGVESGADLTSENGIVEGNATGSINAPGGESINDNLDVATVGGITEGAETTVGIPPKFYDEAAGNLGHTKYSLTKAAGTGGVSQGPFAFFGKEGKRFGNRAEVKELGEIELR
jgi:hypothetical protein